MADPETAPLGARSRALVRYAVKLTRSPESMTEGDLVQLRDAGLDARGIHDVTAVVAYFNFVNRIALGLGVELEDEHR